MNQKTKTSFLLNIPNYLYKSLLLEAQKQNRSLTNLIITILQEYLNKDKA